MSGGAVPAGRRIAALDVARGLALLGILIVNVEFFSLPMAEAQGLDQPAAPLERSLWWVEKVLCEGKFYPLFSLLFGYGLMLQRRRLEATGERFSAIYPRRLVTLAAIGLGHALLLWYGDILFFYSLAGTALYLASGLSRRVLLGLALAGWGLSALMAGTVSALDAVAPAPAPASIEATVESRPLARALERFAENPDPADPVWQTAETVAYAHGPWRDVMGFRALTYLMITVSMAFGGGLQILALFFLGAVLAESDLFAPSASRLRRRLGAAAIGVGLPLSIGSTLALAAGSGLLLGFVWQGALMLGGPLLSLGYLVGAGWLATVGGLGRAIGGALSAAGRTALSCYLGQTVVMTSVMYFWGLGFFGTVERPQRFALAVGLFGLQVVLAVLWLRRFRFGPVEWLWRSATYGAWQPVLRRSAVAD